MYKSVADAMKVEDIPLHVSRESGKTILEKQIKVRKSERRAKDMGFWALIWMAFHDKLYLRHEALFWCVMFLTSNAVWFLVWVVTGK